MSYPATGPSPTDSIRLGVYLDGSFWYHLHYYWLHHHPTARALALEGVLDAVRWYAHGVFDRPVEDVVIGHTHYFQGRRGGIPDAFLSVLEELNVTRHELPFDYRRNKTIGLDVLMALACWELSYQADLTMVVLITGSDNLRPLVELLVGDDVRVLVPQIDVTFIDRRTQHERWLCTSPHLGEAASHTPTWQELMEAAQAENYPFGSPYLPGHSRARVRR